MCGIAGYITSLGASGAVVTLGRMAEAIRHRGPDDFGFYHDDWAHLAHRRLSIIDLQGGHQPMANETGSLWITFNGEIYNHAALRRPLERAGHRYQTRSDTETILHSFEEYGPDCVTRFHGMFAFAIWDSERRRLFCARDRMGIKPFYYSWDGRTFAFASEVKALLEHPAISPALAEDLLPEMLAFGYTSGDRTLFRGIRKLMPGHWLVLDAASGQVTSEQYWDLPQARTSGETVRDVDRRPLIVETQRRLRQSVESHLMSDVPLGVFLSGGVDSSAIAALAQRAAARRMQTFAVGYGEAPYSELGWARYVSETLGTEHREVTVGMDDFFGTLPRLIWQEDEPIAWPSSVSLYFVSKLAAEHVKVVLTGEGSDELFAGYERYRWQQVNDRYTSIYGAVPERTRRRVRRWIAASSLLTPGLRRKLGHTVLGRDLGFESLYLDNFYCAFDPGAGRDPYMQHWNARAGSPLARTLYADQKTYLVELLMKQDQMSMAASLESRVPFLDHALVEFAAGIPDHLKIRGRVQKYVLKAAVRDLLPRDVVHRKKMGFPTPLRQWLMDPRAEPLYRALRSPDGLIAAYLNLRDVDALIESHRSGRADATDQIWRLVNLQLWGDLFLTGRRERAWSEAAVQA